MHSNSWISLSTWLRIKSTRSHNLNGGSRTHCGPGIKEFQGRNGAVFMRLLWVRLEPIINTVISPIKFALSY